MIDDKYINQLDAQDKRWYDYVVKWKGGAENAIDTIITWMDCSKIYDDGTRPMMTNNFGYRSNIAGALYIIEKYSLSDIYINKINIRHEQNLDFEKTNPPIYYREKQRTSRRTNNKTAEITNMFTGEKTTVNVGSGRIVKPKENAATRKAKALNSKSVSFAFNNFKVNK